MLSDQEKAEIREEITHYAEKRAMIPEALRIVQEHHGWVDDDHLREVADLLGMSTEEVDSIATSYNMIFRRPVGRHVVLVCDNVSCWIMGAPSLLRHLQDRLAVGPGQTTKDDRFTLIPSACLGVCHQAPALLVDSDYHENVSIENVDKILERYE